MVGKTEQPEQPEQPPPAPDTLPVTVTVVGVERVTGMGAVLALALVELDVAGVVMNLQGVRIVRRRDGSLTCEAPRWRHPRTGEWLPCITLPTSLSAAIATEVLAMAGAGGVP